MCKTSVHTIKYRSSAQELIAYTWYNGTSKHVVLHNVMEQAVIKKTHIITTHCFSEATAVTRTRLYVTLYVPCLPCSIISSSFLSPLFNLHSPPSYEFMLWEGYAHSEQQSHSIYPPSNYSMCEIYDTVYIITTGAILHMYRHKTIGFWEFKIRQMLPK